MFDPNQLQTAGLLVLVANRIVEGLVNPFRAKFPKVDLWWMIYVSWAVGGGLVYLAELNLFPVFKSVIVGQVLTAVAVGGGAGILSSAIDYLKAKRDKADAEAERTAAEVDRTRAETQQLA